MLWKSSWHPSDTGDEIIIDGQVDLFSEDGARNRNAPTHFQAAICFDGNVSSVVFPGVFNLLFEPQVKTDIPRVEALESDIIC
jgi:hypothetical protein